MSKFNLAPSDAEEEMREAGAREGCEATREVEGVLARNNIAAVPKENKGKSKMKGAHEASGAAGGRQDEGGMCGDFADLALEPSLGLEPLNALVAASSTLVDSRECALANSTHIDHPLEEGATAAAAAEGMSQAAAAPAAAAVARFVLDFFQCPLTMEVMKDPVITADGQTYERSEIERWFALGNRTSPLTAAELPSTNLTPNIVLRNAIRESGLL
jgi:hypothetical protein